LKNLRISLTKNNQSSKSPWLVRWWEEYNPSTDTQRRPCKSFKRKIDAQNFIATMKNDFSDGLALKQADISLKQICDKFIKMKAANSAHSTIRAYKETINRLLNFFPAHISIKLINVESAQKFISELKIIDKLYSKYHRSLSDSTKSRHLREARSIFNIAKKWGYIRTNPFTEVSLGKIRKKQWHFITTDEFKALLNTVDNCHCKKNDTYRSLSLKAFYSVMYGGGLRVGEAVNLLWDNDSIDFKNKQINLFDRPATKKLPPFYVKDYESRTVPMPCWVVESLEQLKDLSDQRNPFAFIDYDGFIRVKEKWQKLLKDNKSKMWENRFVFNNLKTFKNYCKNAGIDIISKKVNLHCLRKAYGTNLANLSTPVHTLKELMGHSKIETTMEYYLFSSDENKKKVIEKLDELWG